MLTARPTRLIDHKWAKLLKDTQSFDRKGVFKLLPEVLSHLGNYDVMITVQRIRLALDMVYQQSLLTDETPEDQEAIQENLQFFWDHVHEPILALSRDIHRVWMEQEDFDPN